ncbi:hypothetical protein DUNSADRAFT_10494 [Dunaliella salina]|uniref:Uncharacterized protein n=1 Tax=Dunaliella salina TaxID=3046 RepID=A0ABQ7GF72_DUNSA|nr:hypothetical protein DUNSADRAFT_10494 [Dunaliella salina]|eukprot:KAF5833256.1 hypothetical protein DUNSADRAFT_10494 [Dunaliella salina]
MARALGTIGACKDEVNYDAFARDLESFFVELEQINTNVVISNDRLSGVLTWSAVLTMSAALKWSTSGNASVSAALEVDQTQLNRLFLNLVRIGEEHGVRFPREFGLFLKQLLYFDRYTRILAPQLQVLSDERIRTANLSSQYGRS